MNSQLSIEFPGEVDLESFWARLGHLRPAAPVAPPAPAPKAEKNDAQQIIWCTEESIALRFSFRAPVYSTKGKKLLKAWDLQHVCISNVISVEDFGALIAQAGFNYDANKLADHFKDGAKARLVKKLGLNEEQAKLVEFRGLSVARHLAGTKVEVGDPRWI